MIKPTDLKTQSNNTFFDNDQGLINPGAHRTFNNAVIDYIQAGQPATFVIDSNDALMAWANNTAGNDYTHVLIRPGTFQTNNTINLATARTKTVIGMGGNKIVKTSSGAGIQATNVYDCLLIGVNVEIPSGAPATAFHSCNHLIGCTGNVTCYGSDNYGTFYNCQYLTNCTGYCVAQNTYASAFNKCQYLTNCYAVSNNTNQNYSYGFQSCNFLTNCNAVVMGGGAAFGFYTCTYLTNCRGAANAQAGYTSYGAAGFFSCKRLIHCTGVGLCSGQLSAYGFNGCRGLLGCSPNGASKSGTYNYCFMTQTGNNSPLDESAPGGFNWSEVI